MNRIQTQIADYSFWAPITPPAHPNQIPISTSNSSKMVTEDYCWPKEQLCIFTYHTVKIGQLMGSNKNWTLDHMISSSNAI